MKIKSKYLIFCIIILSLGSVSCNTEPKPIEIGKDLCELCKMTIMDKRFGGEVITTKGKIYKFDSAECLVEYFKQDAEEKKSVRSLFVIDHSVPGQFIDATKAYYLHSEKLPSPMGANLSSVQDKATIDNYFLEYGGEVWTWDDVLVNIH